MDLDDPRAEPARSVCDTHIRWGQHLGNIHQALDDARVPHFDDDGVGLSAPIRVGLLLATRDRYRQALERIANAGPVWSGELRRMAREVLEDRA